MVNERGMAMTPNSSDLRSGFTREASGINVCIQGHTTACLTLRPRLGLQRDLQVNLHGPWVERICIPRGRTESEIPRLLLRGDGRRGGGRCCRYL